MADREFTNINGIKVCDQTARDNIPTKTSQLTNDSNFVTDSIVDEKISNAQLGGGEVDLSSYAKKTDLPTKTSQLTNDSNFVTSSEMTEAINNAQLGEGVNTSGYKVYNVLDYNISTSNEDNTPALQALMNTVSDNGGGIIFFPVGTYNFKKAATQESGTYAVNHAYAILAKSNVSIVGENMENTILKCTEATPYSLFYKYVGSSNDTIHGCSYSNFTVDCYDTGNTNKVWGKAFFYQYVKDCVFRDLILKGTIATAMGIDFLDHVEINNVTCIDCGRTFISESATTGTSGIGIGTGGFDNENFKITDCVCVGCGQYGIFIENQHTSGWGGNTDDPKGCIISNCITRNGLYRGIGVRGGTNVIVSNCNSYENAQDGIYLDNKCVNVKVSNNNIIGNRGNGILVKSNSNSADIDINDNFVKGNSNYGIHLATNTNGLMLRHNVTKGNTKGGLHSESGLSHSDAIARDNIFIDGEDTTNNLFTGITTYNDLLKNTNVAITAITCNDFSVKKNTTKAVSYLVTPSNADKTKVTISTTDTNYITVDNAAKTVTGIAEGTATLTLEVDGVTTTATVTVLSADAPNLITVDNSEFITNYKLQEDGTIITANNAGVTDYIDISSFAASAKLKIDLYEFSLKTGGRICFYDSNNTLLLTEAVYSGAPSETSLHTMKMNMSSDYSYMRISYNVLGSGYAKISGLANDTLNIASNEFIAGLKIMPDGSTAAENTAYSTDYIDITEFVNAGYTSVKVDKSGSTAGFRLAQYDSSKTSLSESFAIVPNGSTASIDLLSDVAYIRLMLPSGSSTCTATLTFA